MHAREAIKVGYVLDFTEMDFAHIMTWCYDNCQNGYTIMESSVVFDNERDAERCFETFK